MNNKFGSTALGGGSELSVVSGDRYRINGFNIHNINAKKGPRIYIFDKVDNINPDLQLFDYPVSDGLGFVSNYIRGRNIRLGIAIRGDTIKEFTEILDEFRKNIISNEIYLEEKIGDIYRKIKVAIVSSPIEKRYFNITHLKFFIELKALDAYWSEGIITTNSYLGKTASFQEEIIYEGTAKVFPSVNVSFSSASSVNSFEFDIGGTSILISETINTNDIITIDCKTKEVKINNIEVDYDGVFPNIDLESNILNFTINGTFTVDINVLYSKNYI